MSAIAKWWSAWTATPSQQTMLVFLFADAVMSASFYAAFLYLRRMSPIWPIAFHFPSGLMAIGMTMFAVAASVTVQVAVHAAKRRDDSLSVRSLAAAIAGWLVFLFLEAIEWTRLILEGVTLRSNPWRVPLFGASFYTLTGFHILHVIGGLVYLMVVAARVRKYDVGACALYVHYVNLTWLVLFPTLYLTSADLQGL